MRTGTTQIGTAKAGLATARGTKYQAIALLGLRQGVAFVFTDNSYAARG